jgi:HEAT repeat protein
MYSLLQRCIAIVLLSSLLLQSCSGSRHSGILRMADSEGQEAMDKKPSARSRKDYIDLTVPSETMSSMLTPGQAYASFPGHESLATAPTPLVATIAPPNSTASNASASLSTTPAISDRKRSAEASPSASSTTLGMALSPASGVRPVFKKLRRRTEAARVQNDCKPSTLLQKPKRQEQVYVQKLQRLVSAHLLQETPEGMRKMTKVLNQLAALHQEQGEQTGELSHYTDAAVCYQHALRIWEGESSGYKTQIEEAYKGLAQIRTAMIASMQQAQRQATLSDALTPKVLRKEIARDQKKLNRLRKEAKKKLKDIDSAEKNEAEYIEKSKALFADIAGGVAAFLGGLYVESGYELGPAPCRYTVVGLGSMALQQMTPYSDLEFAILMEDSEDPKTLQAHRAYLRQLSHLVHLRVINLGETVVPKSKYDVNLESVSKRGINFDVGGKTPLGRSDKDYDLIQPVGGMLDYLKNKRGAIARIDQLLPCILERTCYVHGDKELYEAYEKASKAFLLQEGTPEEGVPVYQARAREKLLPALDSSGADTVKPRQMEDLAKYEPKFDSYAKGRLYDVKQEIYRLPDRLLYQLAMYYGLLPVSGWDAVAQLQSKGVISAAAARHLQYAVSFAVLLRLRTYLHHGQQKESMGVLRGLSQEAVKQAFSLSPAALQEGGSLFKYYYTALPLHEQMAKFFKLKEGDSASDKEVNCFHKEIFYDDNDEVKEMIFMRIMKYQEAIYCYESAIEKHQERYGDGTHPNLAVLLNNVGTAYARLEETKKGRAYLERALEMCEGLYGDQAHPATAMVLRNLNAAALMLGKDDIDPQEVLQALKAYYEHEDFAQAPSLFTGIGELPKHVDTLDYTLKLIERADAQEKRGDRKDDVATHHERNQWVKTPMALEDLFQRRSIKPGEAERDIQKVLVVGDAGMGKTTLSKKLAYRWSQGQWGQEFKAVYVLPVRNLQESKYDRDTLPTAIVNLCFTLSTEDTAYKAFRHQVSEELKLPTTLVVLDGLDERAGASEALLSQAKSGNHKLLMLSRSYGMEEERALADIEVEHAGLSDEQMWRYVSDNCAQGADLLSLIGKHPSISEIAHVPVNLQILCFLWRDQQAQTSVRQAASQGSLPGLYRVLTQYIWRHYKDKDREALFEMLGKIALKAFEKGDMLISQELVDELVKRSPLRDQGCSKMKDTGCLLLQWLEGNGQYQFPHLTFQEYFAGRWLASQLFSSNEEEKEEAEGFFKKHKYAPQYGRMFSFMAGEVSNHPSQEGIQKLLTLVNEGARDIVGVQHLRLQMRLLHEWLCLGGKQEIEGALSQLEREFQERFKQGIEVARGDSGDKRLLPMLTTALQEFFAAARFIAPQCLGPLLAACKDENSYVRRDAMEALGEVIQAAPALAQDCLAPLLAACKDIDRYVRWAAMKALGEVIKAAPALAQDCLAPLLTACKDENSYVRRDAMEAFGEVIKAAPALAQNCLAPLLAACKDENPYVRRDTIEALGEVIKAAPTLAQDCLTPLLSACKDDNEEVRRDAMEALGEVIKAAPALAQQCIEFLLSACKDIDRYVCWAAMEVLGEVIKAAPALAQDCLASLLAACKDDNEEVRRDAMEALGKVIKAAPALAPQCVEFLLAACKDTDRYVRWAAMDALGEVIKAAPALAPKFLAPLLAACKDTDRYVRRIAMKALGEVIKAAPALTTDCLTPLLVACMDENAYVRSDAIEALGEVIKAVPALATDCLAPLLAACMDENSYVRSDAIEALGEVIKAAPALATDCLAPLPAACMDENAYVRSDAMKALGEVIKAAPALAPQCVEFLLATCMDTDRDVRRAAMKVLGEVIKAAPALATSCLAPLIASCKDTDRYVRRAAMKALGESIKATPALASQCVEFLLAACKDTDREVRRAAMEVPLEQLIEGYWATKNQQLIPMIVPRCYQTPLMVTDSVTPNHKKMVLYDTAGKLVIGWDKPQEEVNDLVKLMRSYLPQATWKKRGIWEYFKRRW